MIFSEAFWRDEIARIGLPEMPLRKAEKTHSHPFLCEQKSYQKLTKEFLQKLGYDHKGMEMLWQISLTRQAIIQVREGHLPENLDIIFKIPLAYGGQIIPENLLLIQSHPFSSLLFQFFRKQCRMFHEQTSKDPPLHGYSLPSHLFVCDIKEPVFIPAFLGWASPNGNAATDRVTQSSINFGGRE